MGSRCEVSLVEEREELCWMCWHQVNVGVRTLTLTRPQTLGMETVAVFAAFVASSA